VRDAGLCLRQAQAQRREYAGDVLRNYAQLRTDLTRERTRYYARLEKLLEDALIKVSAVASKLTTLSAQDMVEA